MKFYHIFHILILIILYFNLSENKILRLKKKSHTKDLNSCIESIGKKMKSKIFLVPYDFWESLYSESCKLTEGSSSEDLIRIFNIIKNDEFKKENIEKYIIYHKIEDYGQNDNPYYDYYTNIMPKNLDEIKNKLEKDNPKLKDMLDFSNVDEEKVELFKKMVSAFEKKFGNEFVYTKKLGGKEKGFIASKGETKFFVKLSNKIKENFIYKVLENLGHGPQVELISIDKTITGLASKGDKTFKEGEIGDIEQQGIFHLLKNLLFLTDLIGKPDNYGIIEVHGKNVLIIIDFIVKLELTDLKFNNLDVNMLKDLLKRLEDRFVFSIKTAGKYIIDFYRAKKNIEKYVEQIQDYLFRRFIFIESFLNKKK